MLKREGDAEREESAVEGGDAKREASAEEGR